MTIDDIMERVSTFTALVGIPGHGADAEADLRTAIQSALDEARADEREWCANIAERLANEQRTIGRRLAIEDCATAIRKEPA